MRRFASELDLGLQPDPLAHGQRIVLLDTEVSRGVLDAGVAEEQLCRAEVTGLLVEQRHLRASKRMRAVGERAQARQLDPVFHEAFVLSRRQMTAGSRTQRRKQWIEAELLTVRDPVAEAGLGVRADLEGHVRASLLLHGLAAREHAEFAIGALLGDIGDGQTDHVGGSELAVECEAEHGEVALAIFHSQAKLDRLDVFDLQGWFRTDGLSLVPGLTIGRNVVLGVFHVAIN